jgi:hypothetical protein
VNERPPEDRWQRFAAAARQGAVTTAPQPVVGQAPPGFVARVVERAMQARREFVALLWVRWSWRVALVTASIAVAAGYFVMRHGNQSCLDVPCETLDVPALESP